MTKRELTDYILDTYSVEPDCPFRMDDDTFVFRHAGNKKWFAIVMNIPYRTLGVKREGNTDVLNVKCDPLVIGSFRAKPGFFPAYHMNKDKWISILLDGTAGKDDIEALLAMSYLLTADRIPKKNVRQQEGA